MYQGKNLFPKKDILIYMLTSLLVDGQLDSKLIKSKFNISTKTFYRYMEDIKNSLFEFGFYYVSIEYDHKQKIFYCKANTRFYSSIHL